MDSPHGHVASVYDHRSESSCVSVRSSCALTGSGAAASGHQFGAVGDAPGALAARAAALDELLQNVVGLRIVPEALQDAQDVAAGVSQFEEALHFAVLLVLVVHAGL